MSSGFGWRVSYVDDSNEPFVLAPPDSHESFSGVAYGRRQVKLTDMEVGHDHGRLFDFRVLDGKRGGEVRRMLEDALARIVKGMVADLGDTRIVLNDLLTWAETWPYGRFHVE